MKRLKKTFLAFFLVLLAAAFVPTEQASAHPGPPVKLALPGMGDAPAATGYWFASGNPGTGNAGNKPVVVGLHGCGGPYDAQGKLTPQWARYAAQFHAEGIHFLVVDSFSGRGVQSLCETPQAQRTIGNEDRRADVQAALLWLANQPGVDAQRLAVVGWSHGAQAVLSLLDAKASATTMKKDGSNLSPAPLAAVAFYPGCGQFARQPGGYALQPDVALLVLIGALDDWTPAAACTQLLAKVKKASTSTSPAPFELVIYPDSYHGFDSPSAVRIRHGIATASGMAHVGGNRAAWEASHIRLFDFLLGQFGQTAVLSHAERFALTGR